MKIIRSMVLISLLCGAQQVLAHEDHDHGHVIAHVSQEAALTVGRDTATQLSKQDGGLGFGQLSASWSELPVKNAKLHKSGDGYYIVAVTNDSEKKTLYVLLSTEGEVYDANFTGEFKDLK